MSDYTGISVVTPAPNVDISKVTRAANEMAASMEKAGGRIEESQERVKRSLATTETGLDG